ncbi:MAG: DUF4293 domain-containing protein [Ferruginibacter sp.]
MIQRIQSIWLLLASACAFVTLKVPFYSGTNAANVPSYRLMGTENFLLMLLTIAIGIIALFTIFLYSNRTLQMRLCLLGILLEGLLIFLYYKETTTFIAGTGTFSLTAVLQVLILIFFILAIRGINRDNKIIKESNRLR